MEIQKQSGARDKRNHRKTSGRLTTVLMFLCLLSSSCVKENINETAKENVTVSPPVTITRPSVDDELQERITSLQVNGALHVQNKLISTVNVILPVYERFDFRPIWKNRQSVYQLLAALETIGDDGLDSADYHYPLLLKLLTQLDSTEYAPPALVADFDLLLSDSLVRLCHHLLGGKINPVELDANWNMERNAGNLDWIVPRFSTAIADSSIDSLLESFRPQSEIYTRLRSALARYKSIEVRGGWGRISGGSLLKRGVTDSRVVALKKRLIVTDDMPDFNPEDPYFDEVVENAVRHFQQRHALPPDGIVGGKTLAALNQSIEEKANQIQVNLERARWVLHNFADRLVLVDITGFQVQYLVDKTPVFEARSQIGTPDRKTPVFKSEITYLELNPTWTVPETIFLEDILPEVKADPDYLQKKGLQVISHSGEKVDEKIIDWSEYPETDFPYILRQDPGPTNAMGQIKFMFPNIHAVYLHDTPNKSLFNSAERAFSSGCVRIENPFKLAELLLDDDEWSRENLMEVIASREIKQIPLKSPVTVLFLYRTVLVKEDGSVIFKKDLYERDKKILNSLNAEYILPPISYKN